jgi:hypothetical protein
LARFGAAKASAASAANKITTICKNFPCLILPPNAANKNCEHCTQLQII